MVLDGAPPSAKRDPEGGEPPLGRNVATMEARSLWLCIFRVHGEQAVCSDTRVIRSGAWREHLLFARRRSHTHGRSRHGTDEG